MYASLEAAFRDEAAAYRYVEARVWPSGPVCPHCGGKERIGKMNGKSTRIGTYKCYACRKPFTVKMGTVWEDSHVPLRLWLQAVYLLCTTKTSISIGSLQRTLGVTLITTCFMAERICNALEADGSYQPDEPSRAQPDATAEGSVAKVLPKARQLVGRIRARALAERDSGPIEPSDAEGRLSIPVALDDVEPPLHHPTRSCSPPELTVAAAYDSATM